MTALTRPAHTLSPEEAARQIGSDVTVGLTLEEARQRLARGGPNALPEVARRSLLKVFARQFMSPLIFILFVAAGIAVAVGQYKDAGVIFVVVTINAVIGAYQERRAERSLMALRKRATHKARLIRGGKQLAVVDREVVEGDLLLLEAGDAVAADARLFHAESLRVAEASLTGESTPVTKNVAPVEADAPIADRTNVVFAGTHVTAGRARALVIATGMNTELGQIARLAETGEPPKTPLERRIDTFGRQLIVAAVAMFGVVIGLGLLRGIPFAQILMIGISQVVGMIPEGLPVALTVALAVGVQRMARRGAVVRSLAAVETLGSTTVICTDKTGTLTRNEMTVTALLLPDGRTLTVDGTGYTPEGTFFDQGRPVDPKAEPALRALLEAGALCNDAQLTKPEGAAKDWKWLGDPTEVALLTAAVKGGVGLSDARQRLPRQAELPFDPAKKMMATQHATAAGPVVLLKGAPEEILDLCGAGVDRAAVHASAERMANEALRILAVARVDGTPIDRAQGFAPFRGKAVLLGLVGQIDPPRPEVKEAVQRCRAAGLRPVLVTGDHKATGVAVARTLGISRDGDEAIDGRALAKISDADLEARIDRISVFARVHPEQKLRIVTTYQRRGDVVAMTGDGVNDAPALMKANVGVAMGKTGTEVAKEAAKIVISDDNFATIVAAVEEGRVVYRNIKKLILYLFSTSVAEVLVLLTALAVGYPPPLAAVQILWINLVTEGTVTVNLIMEAPEGDEMSRAPIPPNEPLITRALLSRMLFITPTIALCTLGWFAWRSAAGVSPTLVQTETFTVLAVCCWFNVLNCRSARKSAFSASLFKNKWLVGALVLSNLLHAAVVFLPPLNSVFHTTPIGLTDVLAIGAVGSLVLWVEELRKLVVRWRDHRAIGPAATFRASPT